MEDMVCVDTETGGFSATKNGLCSVTMKVVGKDIIENIFIKPNPNLSYNSQAMNINHLSLDILNEKGISEEDAITTITEFLNDNFDSPPIILGHNISFDIRFLDALFERDGKVFTTLYNGTKDTMKAMKQLRAEGKIEIENVKLNTCYNHFFDSDIENAHTAEGDVIATEKIFHKIEEILDEI